MFFYSSCRGLYIKCGKVALLWMFITSFLEVYGGGICS